MAKRRKGGRLLQMSAEEINERLEAIAAELLALPRVNNQNRFTVQPLKHSLICERRRLKIALASRGGYLTLTEQIAFIQSKGGVCEICGDNSNPTIDHIIPISKGGSNTIENLRVLCGACNSRKGDRNG